MKINFIAVAVLLGSIGTKAQTCQKDNLSDIISSLPSPFSNAAAVKKAAGSSDVTGYTGNLYAPFAQEMQTLLKKNETPNPVTMRQQQQGEAMEEKFKKDNVEQMTPEQKLAYAKKNNLGGEAAGGSINLAEKLKDPAFKKKFEAMSPQEKMTFMQQQGVMKPTTPASSGNPMQGDFQTMMQDPAFRAKWAKMSKAEQQAYIENLQKNKGYDKSKQAVTPVTDEKSGSLSDAFADDPVDTKAASPVADAIAKTKALASALQQISSLSVNAVDQLKTINTKIDADAQKAGDDALQKQIKEGLSMAKTQNKMGKNWIYTDPKADHDIRMGSLNKSLNESNTTLSKLSGEWTQRSPQLKKLAADYQAAMVKINYGETLYADDKQLMNLATLAGQQAMIFSSLKDIADAFNKAADAAVKAQENLQNEMQHKPGKRELVSEGG